MPLGRRPFLTAMACVLPAAWAHAKDTALNVPTSLPQALLTAKAKGEPLVVLFIGSQGQELAERLVGT